MHIIIGLDRSRFAQGEGENHNLSASQAAEPAGNGRRQLGRRQTVGGVKQDDFMSDLPSI